MRFVWDAPTLRGVGPLACLRPPSCSLAGTLSGHSAANPAIALDPATPGAASQLSLSFHYSAALQESDRISLYLPGFSREGGDLTGIAFDGDAAAAGFNAAASAWSETQLTLTLTVGAAGVAAATNTIVTVAASNSIMVPSGGLIGANIDVNTAGVTLGATCALSLAATVPVEVPAVAAWLSTTLNYRSGRSDAVVATTCGGNVH